MSSSSADWSVPEMTYFSVAQLARSTVRQRSLQNGMLGSSKGTLRWQIGQVRVLAMIEFLLLVSDGTIRNAEGGHLRNELQVGGKRGEDGGLRNELGSSWLVLRNELRGDRRSLAALLF